jgi:dihydrofolate synthase/folylpolyglutamate synthase
MNFQESLDYLYGLGNEVSTMKLGLENIAKLLAALGNPEKKYFKVQVAGTNGKGSTCAFLEAICVSAGIEIGLTTSPHLVSITERIKINGKEINKENFARHATKIRETSKYLVLEKKLETVPTFFEQITASALLAFAEAKIELAILETGLGGRFDATTAALAEIIAITPIDFDHQQVLGNSLDKIAAEKAAIIRKDTKLIVAAQGKEVEKVVFERCAIFGVKPNIANFACEIVGKRKGKFIVDFLTEEAKYENVKLNLPGRHQIENAKIAILLAEALQENFKITKENIIDGLQTAVHKGRLEFSENILYDGAHNISGARALREFLDEFVEQPLTIVFGAMKDKDLREIADILFPIADKLIFTKIDNSRSMETTELLNFLPENFDIANVFQTETVKEALELARKTASEKDLICVTGSLYLVGEMQKHLADNSKLNAV